MGKWKKFMAVALAVSMAVPSCIPQTLLAAEFSAEESMSIMPENFEDGNSNEDADADTDASTDENLNVDSLDENLTDRADSGDEELSTEPEFGTGETEITDGEDKKDVTEGEPEASDSFELAEAGQATEGYVIQLYSSKELKKTYVIPFAEADKAKAPAALTRSGYIFKEWNTKANGKGTSYKPGDSIKKLLEEIVPLNIFLDMAPEDEVINPSSLTKFRKLRLKDMNLLDMLIAKTVQLALEKGIIKSKSIIVDATHTKSRYNQKTPRQVLQEQSKKLRRSIYEIDETMKEKFPDKNTEDSLEKELKYCKQLIDVVKGNEEICSYPKVQEKLNLLEESVTDDMEHLETSKDEDAKTGHKTADTSFFGYKTHIAMTEERIITAATITSGEKTDGKELPKLVQKSKAAGIQIESVIGDMAYSEKKNIEAAKECGYELIAKLNPVITQGNRRKEDEFEFNKDAGMYQCKAGHLVIHKYFDKRKKDKKTKTHVWSIFSILKNVNVVLIVVAVIKKEPKRKHTQKQSFAIPTVNRLNFRKLSISKKKCGNAIK